MAEITTEMIAEKEITVFRVTGDFTFEVASDAIHKFYKADIPENFLWDLSEDDEYTVPVAVFRDFDEAMRWLAG